MHRPDAGAHEPRVGRQDPRPSPAGDEPGRHDREDAAHVDRLGRQVGGERGEQRDDDLERRVRDPPPHGAQTPGRRRPRSRSRRSPRRRTSAPAPTTENVPAIATRERGAVQDQGRGVVDQALALEDRHDPRRDARADGRSPWPRPRPAARRSPRGANAAAPSWGIRASATPPTTSVVNRTRPTASSPIGRRLALKSRIGVK